MAVEICLSLYEPFANRNATCRCTQYKSSITKFQTSIIAITPATESVRASLASRLTSNLAVFIADFSKKLLAAVTSAMEG